MHMDVLIGLGVAAAAEALAWPRAPEK